MQRTPCFPNSTEGAFCSRKSTKVLEFAVKTHTTHKKTERNVVFSSNSDPLCINGKNNVRLLKLPVMNLDICTLCFSHDIKLLLSELIMTFSINGSRTNYVSTTAENIFTSNHSAVQLCPKLSFPGLPDMSGYKVGRSKLVHIPQLFVSCWCSYKRGHLVWY